jgi:hypothetical protein
LSLVASFIGLFSYAASASAKETPLLPTTGSARAEAAKAAASRSSSGDGASQPAAERDVSSASSVGAPTLSTPRGSVRGYFSAGPGGLGAGDTAVPGGGVTLKALYETANGLGVGATGMCGGGVVNADKGSEEHTGSVLCSASALVQWLGPQLAIAPVFGLGAGYAYSAHSHTTKEAVAIYSGSGAAFSASVGVVKDRKWLFAIRAEIPAFRMSERSFKDDTRYAFATLLEVGVRFPGR